MLVGGEVRMEKHVLKLVRSDVRIEKACLRIGAHSQVRTEVRI